MESITIKVEQTFAKEIEKAMSPLYTTKTEFIREAIRDKIEKFRYVESMTKEEVIREVMKYHGKSKKKTTDKERLEAKWKASKMLLEDLEKRFS